MTTFAGIHTEVASSGLGEMLIEKIKKNLPKWHCCGGVVLVFLGCSGV